MGDTISTLVFRPPRPTYLKPSKYFFLDVDQGIQLTHSSNLICANASVRLSSASAACHQTGLASTPRVGMHRIPAFIIKRKGAHLTVLFSHGNAEDIGIMYDRMKDMSKLLNVNIMAYDYTGYGYSTGSPSEEMCYRNIEAAYGYLRQTLQIPASQIVLFGRSLGSGPSCYMAAKSAIEGDSVAGLILHSPFLSIYRIVINSPNLGVVGDMFPNGLRAPDVACPTMIIHGTVDEVVPFYHGLELLTAIPDQFRSVPFWAEGMGHNNIEIYHREEFTSRCKTFLERYCEGCEEAGAPLQIPPEERAIVDPVDLKIHEFYVNPTWVNYGRRLVGQTVARSACSSACGGCQNQLLDSDDESSCEGGGGDDYALDKKSWRERGAGRSMERRGERNSEDANYGEQDDRDGPPGETLRGEDVMVVPVDKMVANVGGNSDADADADADEHNPSMEDNSAGVAGVKFQSMSLRGDAGSDAEFVKNQNKTAREERCQGRRKNDILRGKNLTEGVREAETKLLCSRRNVS